MLTYPCLGGGEKAQRVGENPSHKLALHVCDYETLGFEEKEVLEVG